MPTQKKIDIVSQLKTKLEKAKALVLTDPSGLTHKQLEDLRKLLKKTEAEFTITKNTLLKRALEEVRKSVDETSLSGSTATLFAYADEVSPIKALTEFLKSTGMGKIKVGLLGKTELSQTDIERLAKLPPREMLLAQLVRQMQTPLYGLHNALSWNLRQLVWTLEAVRNRKR